jgi:hypothetical protein
VALEFAVVASVVVPTAFASPRDSTRNNSRPLLHLPLAALLLYATSHPTLAVPAVPAVAAVATQMDSVQ